MATSVSELPTGLLGELLQQETFCPAEPRSLEDLGVSPILVESLVLKFLLQMGSAAGRDVARRICVPAAALEPMFSNLRARQVLFHKGQAALNDYYYALTDEGVNRAQAAMKACAYVGPTPVPLEDYVNSVEAQTIRDETAQRQELLEAFADISISHEMLDILGPAVNSGAGLFLYGAPGNGKTTLARRITKCFGQHIWIPHALIDDGQIIKLYDAACHEAIKESEDSLLKQSAGDTRWLRIRRPTVVVGGELTMDSLEIRHDAMSNVSEASLQLKSNCGCLLIDDFGRQRVEPMELLNRWIIPLENRFDYLTLATGKKICVPFDQLIIFSTNLEPTDLADEAFLRRIPYKVEVHDPTLEEFRELFAAGCRSLGFKNRPEAVDYLVQKHYRPHNRPLRRCHARDLLLQIRNYCVYQGTPVELRPDYLDRAVNGYFAATAEKSKPAN